MENRFHAHLDECAQCQNNPFALCSIGGSLLMESALQVEREKISVEVQRTLDNPLSFGALTPKADPNE